MIEIFIIDDHSMLINTLKKLFSSYSEINVIDTALNGAILLEKLKKHQPDLLLLDVSMPVMNGIEAARAVKQLYPAVKILIFSTYVSKEQVKELTEIGVEGYISKYSGTEELMHAMKTIMSGATYADKKMHSSR